MVEELYTGICDEKTLIRHN